jgi:hypothetical protein
VSEARREIVRRACVEAGLDPSLAGLVESLMERDDTWRTCCGSSCNPCTVPLAAAVDRARELGA